MAESGHNVITFRGARMPPPAPPPVREPLLIQIPTHDLDRLPAILMHVTVATELAARVALKREVGDETVLEGIRQIFAALANLVGM